MYIRAFYLSGIIADILPSFLLSGSGPLVKTAIQHSRLRPVAPTECNSFKHCGYPGPWLETFRALLHILRCLENIIEWQSGRSFLSPDEWRCQVHHDMPQPLPLRQREITQRLTVLNGQMMCTAYFNAAGLLIDRGLAVVS